MKFFPSIPNRRLAFELCIILFAGLAVSAVLIKASAMQPKWLKAVILGLIGGAGLLILPGREKMLLCLSGFLLPLEINVNFFYETVHYRRPVEGLVLSAFDVPFFLLMLLWMFRVINDYRIRISFYPHITWPFFFMWILCLAGLYPAAVSFPIKISVLWLMFKSWLVLWYLANNIKDRETVYLLVGVILLSGFFQAMIGIGQHLKGGPLGLGMLGEQEELHAVQAEISRIGGTIGHPNKLALFLGTLLQLNLSWFFTRFPENVRSIRFLYLLPFCPMLMTLLLAYSRGGWISFLTGGTINCYWCLVKRTGKKVGSAIIVFGFFFCFAATVLVLVESVRNRLFMDDKGAAEIRKPLQEIALNIISHNPFLGVGLNNYTSVIRKYDISDMGASYHFPAAVHNEFLLIAAECGLPVLFLFLYIMGYVFFVLWRIAHTKSDPVIPYLAVGFFCSLISWSIHNQKEFQYVFFTTRFWFHIGIMLAMDTLAEKQEKEGQVPLK